MIVNGFWYGKEIDELSIYCIQSWIKKGFEFHLWSYNKTQVEGAITKNASLILKEDQYFTYDGGHSAGSPVAFSNLFRAELLYQKGGLYVDLDMLCVNAFNFSDKRFVFSKQGHNAMDWLESKYGKKLSVATSIIYSKNKGEKIFKEWVKNINELRINKIKHGDLGPDLFTKLVIENKLEKYLYKKEYFCPADFYNFSLLLERKYNSWTVHLYSSMWEEEFYYKFKLLKELYGN